MFPYKCECIVHTYIHIHGMSYNQSLQTSSSQHALLLTVKGEYMLKLSAISCVLLNIDRGGDLLVFKVILFWNLKGFLVCVSYWDYHCAEE